MDKSLSIYGGYGSYPILKDLEDLRIFLPTKNSKPDFQFMQDFITAIQKLAIKDVVLYAEKKLAATREVIERR